MQAFLNDPELKTGLIAEVRKHREQDQIIKGTYGKMNGVWKGCAVGCSIRSFNLLRGTHHDTSDHAVYEQFGIPQWLARVQDTIFEGLPEDRAVLWPEEFWTAIVPGADLDKVKTPFILFILRSNLKNFDHEKFPNVKAAIDGVIALYESGEPSESAESARSARSAARSAAESARSAAESAWSAEWSAWSAWSAEWSAAESARSAAWSAWSAAESARSAAWSAWSAWSAEWSAAESARSAAESARSAARSAAESARSAAWSAWSAARSAAESARSAESAEWSAAYVGFANKLIDLLKSLAANSR